MDTGAKIKQLRESLDMTQEDLGKLLGVKKAAINKYETGTVINLKRSTIENLCNIFNVTPQYLLSDSDPSQSSSSAPAPELAEQEGELIAVFRRLSDIDQEKLIAYGEGLAAAGANDLNARLMEEGRKIAEEYKKAAELKSSAK